MSEDVSRTERRSLGRRRLYSLTLVMAMLRPETVSGSFQAPKDDETDKEIYKGYEEKLPKSFGFRDGLDFQELKEVKEVKSSSSSVQFPLGPSRPGSSDARASPFESKHSSAFEDSVDSEEDGDFDLKAVEPDAVANPFAYGSATFDFRPNKRAQSLPGPYASDNNLLSPVTTQSVFSDPSFMSQRSPFIMTRPMNEFVEYNWAANKDHKRAWKGRSVTSSSANDKAVEGWNPFSFEESGKKKGSDKSPGKFKRMVTPTQPVSPTESKSTSQANGPTFDFSKIVGLDLKDFQRHLNTLMPEITVLPEPSPHLRDGLKQLKIQYGNFEESVKKLQYFFETSFNYLTPDDLQSVVMHFHRSHPHRIDYTWFPGVTVRELIQIISQSFIANNDDEKNDEAEGEDKLQAQKMAMVQEQQRQTQMEQEQQRQTQMEQDTIAKPELVEPKVVETQTVDQTSTKPSSKSPTDPILVDSITVDLKEPAAQLTEVDLRERLQVQVEETIERIIKLPEPIKGGDKQPQLVDPGHAEKVPQVEPSAKKVIPQEERIFMPVKGGDKQPQLVVPDVAEKFPIVDQVPKTADPQDLPLSLTEPRPGGKKMPHLVPPGHPHKAPAVDHVPKVMRPQEVPVTQPKNPQKVKQVPENQTAKSSPTTPQILTTGQRHRPAPVSRATGGGCGGGGRASPKRSPPPSPCNTVSASVIRPAQRKQPRQKTASPRIRRLALWTMIIVIIGFSLLGFGMYQLAAFDPVVF